ncbi:MAG: hypothetical protein JKY56_24705 [Kofleriaceae bacterium]|nr:hypothetical protein [Kofleriaceae bacterium]
MLTKNSHIGAVLAALALHSACSFDPEPEAQTIFVGTSQYVVLTADPLPADDVYWVFSELPLPHAATEKKLTWLTAEFIPVLPGEYIVDRWVLSGPAGIWADRFVINVSGAVRSLVIDGPERLVVGQTGEFRVWVENQEIGLPGLRFECKSSYSVQANGRNEVIRTDLAVGVDGTMQFTPDVEDYYSISCDGFYDLGVVKSVRFSVNSHAE